MWDIYSRLWKDPNAQRHGRSGQSQQGVDIYGHPTSAEPWQLIGVQCKLVNRGALTFMDISDEIAKAAEFTPALAEFIIATTANRDANLQETLRAIGAERESAGAFPVHVVFCADICTQLTAVENADLLAEHYGTSWTGLFKQANMLMPVRLFRRETLKLGDDQATNFLYLLDPVTTAFEAASRALSEASTGSGAKRGIVILGEANAGKTRLAFEVLQQTLPDWHVLRWTPAAAIQDLPLAPTLWKQRLVVFIDDLQEYVPGSASASQHPVMFSDPRADTLKAMLATLRESAERAVVVVRCTPEIGSSHGMRNEVPGRIGEGKEGL